MCVIICTLTKLLLWFLTQYKTAPGLWRREDLLGQSLTIALVRKLHCLLYLFDFFFDKQPRLLAKLTVAEFNRIFLIHFILWLPCKSGRDGSGPTSSWLYIFHFFFLLPRLPPSVLSPSSPLLLLLPPPHPLLVLLPATPPLLLLGFKSTVPLLMVEVQPQMTANLFSPPTPHHAG